MNLLSEENFRISGVLPYWRRILSFFFLTLGLFIILYNFVLPYTDLYDEETYNPFAGIALSLIPFFAGVMIGKKRDLIVNKDLHQLILKSSIFRFTLKNEKRFYKQLEYISIFRNYAEHYEGRLFYDDREYINLFEIRSHERAMFKVTRVANGLSIPIHNLVRDDSWLDDSVPDIPKEERTISVYLSEGTRPFWQSVIAAFFYTLAVLCIYMFIVKGFKTEFKDMKNLAAFIELAVFCIGMGVGFSLVRDYMFDTKNFQYKKQHRIGPLKFGSWRAFRKVEYVSVHLKRYQEFHVSLWYNSNKHITLGAYGDYDDAMVIGKRIAKKFKTQLYDATQPRDERWVDI